MDALTQDVATVLDAYLECAIWADLRDEEGESLDHAFDASDLAPEALVEARRDVEDFVRGAGRLLTGLDPVAVGHDFWLTRNRHGAGFWDRGLGSVGERLTEMAHAYGEARIYVGDDGRVYLA